MWRTDFWMKWKTETSPIFKSSSDPHVDYVEQTVIQMHRDFFYQVLWCLYVSVCACEYERETSEFTVYGSLVTDLLVCVQIFIFNERSVVVSVCETSLACWSFLWFSCWWRINWISGLLAHTSVKFYFRSPAYWANETFLVIILSLNARSIYSFQ